MLLYDKVEQCADCKRCYPMPCKAHFNELMLEPTPVTKIRYEKLSAAKIRKPLRRDDE